MGLMGELTYPPVSPGVLGCFRTAKTQLRQGQKCYAELDLSQSVQEVACVEHKLFLVLVWELHALESSVLGGFEDEGGKEREVWRVYHTKWIAAQSWRAG